MVVYFDGALARWSSKLYADPSLSLAVAVARHTGRRNRANLDLASVHGQATVAVHKKAVQGAFREASNS